MPAEHETLTYELDGMAVTAFAWGSSQDPLALLLHGYPDTPSTWRHLGPELAAAGFRAVAPFTRGYAPTGLPPDGAYDVGALAHDAIRTHAVLGGDERAVLVGHDWGAATAYAADAAAPGLFARVVTMAVPPGPALARLARTPLLLARQMRRSWYMGFQQLPGSERTLDGLIPKLWRDWSPGYDGAADAQRALEALAAPANRTAALRYYRHTLQPWLQRGDHTAQRRAMRRIGPAPTLYLHGADDGCMLAEVAELARRDVPTEIVPGAGHFLQLERPGEVNARVLAHLTG